MRVRSWTPILNLVLGLLVLGAVAWFAGEYATAHFSPSRLREIVKNVGAPAPLVFVAAYALAPLFLFPASLLTATAGLLWDWDKALMFAVIGSNLCANLGFGLARMIGQERFQRLTRGRLLRFDRKLEGAGFGAIAVLRMFPVMPFSVLSYTAGVSRIRWRDFALGHFLGTLPGMILFVSVLETVVD